MKLTPHERLRSKRERWFQAELLSRLQKPKANRIISFINSPATIWLMTAIFVGIGGALITNQQQCRVETDKTAFRFYKLNREVFERREYLGLAANRAKRVSDIRDAAARMPTIYSDLKQHTALELNDEINFIRTKIDTGQVFDWIKESGHGFEGISFSPEEALRYSQILRGSSSGEELDDSELIKVQHFIQKLYFLAYRDWRIAQSLSLLPKCGIKYGILSSAGIDSKPLLAVVAPPWVRLMGVE